MRSVGLRHQNGTTSVVKANETGFQRGTYGDDGARVGTRRLDPDRIRDRGRRAKLVTTRTRPRDASELRLVDNRRNNLR
jgi:hypothetical protein